MNNDPYAAPTADLDNTGSTATIPTSIWTGKGRLSVVSFFGQSFVLILLFVLFVGALVALFSVLGGAMPSDPTDIDFSNPILIVLGILAAILYMVMIYITVCMTIKRLHDRNHSGWWSAAIFIGSLIPFVNIVALIGMIYVYFFPGNKTGNRFGGRRETKGWEKICAILYLVLIIVSIIGGVMFAGSIAGGMQ